MATAELLSPAHNYAIVQLPGRQFPGVVVQGDSLNSMVQDLLELHQRALRFDDEQLADGLAGLLDLLRGARDHYEKVCRERGLSLPYPPFK